jgi:hydrogenase maturation protease
VSKPASQYEREHGAAKAGTCLRVVGLGNPYTGDDSVGLEIVNRLRARGDTECELVALARAGVELVEVLRDVEAVLLIDAVSSGSPAGTLHLIPLPSAEVEPRVLVSLSSHGWGLAETLELMEALGRPFPRLALLGVEVETVEPGAPRSKEVEAAIDIVVSRFSALWEYLAGAEKNGWSGPLRFVPGDTTFPGL